VVLVEVQAHSLNSWDKQDELSELVELWKHLDEVEVARITWAGQLVALVDLGLPPIQVIS
jgi:hypothetical protein